MCCPFGWRDRTRGRALWSGWAGECSSLQPGGRAPAPPTTRGGQSTAAAEHRRHFQANRNWAIGGARGRGGPHGTEAAKQRRAGPRDTGYPTALANPRQTPTSPHQEDPCQPSIALHNPPTATTVTKPAYCQRRTRCGSEATKNFVYLKIGLIFPAPLIHFIFCLRKVLLMWMGGGVGRPGLARAPNNPRPPRGSLSNSLHETLAHPPPHALRPSSTPSHKYPQRFEAPCTAGVGPGECNATTVARLSHTRGC